MANSPDESDENARKHRYDAAYPVLAHRIANWHQLLWQVPLFAFTAQAFTFTIALDPNSSRVGRLIACTISVLISVVSLVTLVRQRKADKLDSRHLNAIEKSRGWPKEERLHGKGWAKRRTRRRFDWKWLDKLVGRWKLTTTWAVAFLILLVLALGVAAFEIFYPEALDATMGPLPIQPQVED
jgi:hypothetical protein